MRSVSSFPEKTEVELRQIEKDFYRQFCYTIVESIYGFSCSDEEMKQRVIFENMDEVNRLVDAAGGGIFMLAHMGNWEWMASVQQWVSPGVTEINVYRRQKTEIREQQSQQADQELLKARGIRTLLEWNPGNHFRDAGLRTAKAFAWILQQE